LIVLDTHVLVWLVARPEQLSTPARKSIAAARKQDGILVSSISVWEVAMLVTKQRLVLTMAVEEWLKRVEALPFLHFVPVDNSLALRSVTLPGRLHGDPADRLIVATALRFGAPLVTRDRRLRRYSHVKTIW